MKNDLVETVKFCFTSKVVNQLSELVDEPAPGVENGLGRSVPLVLTWLLRQSEHGMAPTALLDMARDADAAEVLTQLANPQDTTGYERSANLLLDLLGNTYRSTVNQIAADAGIRPSASGTLLQVAATAVLGVLGKFAVENELTPTEFIHWLQSQKDTISATMLPTAGAGLLAPPGPARQQHPAATPPRMVTTPVRRAAPHDEAVARHRPATPSTDAAGLRWQWGALLLLAVSLGYFFGRDFFGRPNPPAAAAAVNPPLAADAAFATTTTAAPATATATLPPAPAPAAGVRTANARAARRATEVTPTATGGRYDIDRDTYVYDTGRPIVLTLANGSTQRVGANSTENRLYTFLATAAVQVDSVNRTKGWINLDRVYFEPGVATLRAQSWPQLRNIANILKMFPNSVVKVGGYTDSLGLALKNQELSEDRARAAMLALASLGVSIDHLQAKGYGAKYFVAPNLTPASRSLNRRVSIRVVQK